MIVRDKAVIDECRTFVWHNGKMQAQPGYHDDFVIMLVGLCALDMQCPINNRQQSYGAYTSSASMAEKHRDNAICVPNAVDDEDFLAEERGGYTV